MPELPEVETVVRHLRPQVSGARLVSSSIFDPKLKPVRPKRLCRFYVQRVSREGKQIVLSFSSKGRKSSYHCAFHLRMSGRLIWNDSKSTPLESSQKHIRAQFEFDRGKLFFIDPRRFGTIRIVKKWENIQCGGIDPVSKVFSLPTFKLLLDNSRQSIKAWLLRQDKIVGIGNIYASEILHAALIHPERSVASLSEAEIGRLYRSVVRILNAAIDHCGTTFSDFQDSNGLSGSYQHYLRVYQREGEKCRRCRSIIGRLMQQQRSTFFCDHCQK